MVLIFLSFIAVFPLYWMVISSLKNSADIYSYDWIATSPTLENYISAVTTVPLLRMMLNSAIISVSSAVLQLTIALLFAYAFMRWNFRGKNILYGILTISWLIPIQVIMVPNYIEIINLGLGNTLIAIVLPHCCSVFANINTYQNCNSIPRALIDAARLDGSSEFQILKDIILPNMRAAVSSLCIVLIITAWNDYLWPSLIARSAEKSPVQVGLKSFVIGDTNMWGSAMAAATLSCVPILIAYLFMNRQIINSFMKGGIKR